MEWAYIAGLFDGEGTIGYDNSKKRTRVLVSITNTNRTVLEELEKFCGYGGIYPSHSAKDYKKHKKWHQAYLWQISRRVDVSHFLTHALPFLIIKKERTEKTLAMVLEYIAADSETIERRKTNAQAIMKLRQQKVSYRNIASKIGLSHQRAWEIGSALLQKGT